MILMTGTTIAQAIPIAISPILTRIYTPEDFGIYAIFLAISAIFGSISNARYELAIMLPKKDEDAINIFALGLILTSSISLLILVLIIIFIDYFVQTIGNEDIRIWLYFVPVAIFFTGFYKLLNYFNNRKKYYKDIKNTIIIKSIVLAIVQLSIGFIKTGATGLISGQIISNIFANVKLLNNIIKDKFLLSKVSKLKILALAKRYKDFPKYSMWAGLFNTLSNNLINILIPTIFSLTTLGFYSLVNRVLGMPSNLVGGAIGQVFYQTATKEKQQTGKAINTFNSTIKKLLIIGIPSFGVLFFIVEDLFAFVFGEDWRVAGVYAQLLIPVFFVRFVVGPLSMLNMVFLKNKNGLIFQFILLFSTVLVFVVSKYLFFSFENFLTLFSVSWIFVYTFFGMYLNKLKKGIT
jgi:O-antigen/teichoic acid export membrane protein